MAEPPVHLDRLTRHVGDMQNLISVFEQHGVALVCVTQSLDTSSSHGRLALHLWTPFAQFERDASPTRDGSCLQALWPGPTQTVAAPGAGHEQIGSLHASRT
jgi:hypothetical protein